MIIVWEPLECYQENGPIAGYQYRVYYDITNYSDATVARNVTILNLLLHRTLKAFSVAAMNEAGIGEHCPPLDAFTCSSNIGNIYCTCTCS